MFAQIFVVFIVGTYGLADQPLSVHPTHLQCAAQVEQLEGFNNEHYQAEYYCKTYNQASKDKR